MHFDDVIRQIVEDGDPIVVEWAGTPQVAVISLADLERLCGPLDEDSNSTSDATGTDWWDKFERELRDLPVE